MAKCKNCINLQNHWCDMVSDSPDENVERECCTYERMTNADKIRLMSDEELAEFMEPREFDCADFCADFCNGCMGKCKHNMGKDFLLEWLQSEVEE